MVTLQNHVSSILAKSAKTAADEIIKLFDSSFEAFTEELRKRQDEIDALRRKLELAETEPAGPVSSGPAYLCVQCGVSLNCVIPLEENQKAHDTDNKSPQDLETDFSDQTMGHAPIEESDTEEGIEIEVPAEEDSSYSELTQADKSTGCTLTAHQEEPTRTEESNPQINPQRRGRGRPRKHHADLAVCMPLKRGRGRPRKTAVVFTLKSPNMFSAEEHPKKAVIQQESTNKPSNTHTLLSHSVSKKELQIASKVQSLTKRSGRRGRPPRHLLNPLLIPFAEAKSILPGHKNHMHGPGALTSELEDRFVSETSKHVPLDNSEKDQPYKRLQQKDRGWIMCSKCPRQFPSKTKLQAHMKFHLRKGEIPCSICGMTFIGKSQMNNHLRVHTGEKPFSCSFCPRRFPNQSQYKKHMLGHTAPDYACEVCGLRSSQMCRDTFRRAHLRSKEPCSNCASIYT
ncbi:uncharacterized protein [Salminus brasiliensis]|uniref:uncharacterized protein n=1 Tax=Salminus brasiliensis TaxID=930266 RepID=UPI003B8388B0